MTWIRTKMAALALLSAAMLLGCTDVPANEETETKMSGKVADKTGAFFQFSQDVAIARSQLAGNTLHFTDPFHGTQIEYFNSNGRAHLWYPGNRSGVPSLWKVEASNRSKNPVNICFQYPGSSYNPATQQFGGKWECRPIDFFALSLDAVHVGDQYGLKNGSIPKPLPKKRRLSPSQVASHIGKSGPPKTTWKREAN